MMTSVAQAMRDRVTKGEFPGMVILLAEGDRVEVETIGTMSFEDSAPLRRDTLFRIASLTKPITATATMLLVEQGLIDLHEPVDRLLPELADRRVLRRLDSALDDTVPAERPITAEDLLTFRMGNGLITEPSFNPPYPIVRAAEEAQLVLGPPDPRTPHHPDEWLKLFGSLPLMHQPGERWQYNTGTLILGVLIARASGMSFPDFLRERVFGPLGMADTGFSTSADQVHRIPPQYFMGQIQDVSAPEIWAHEPAFPSGSAGLLSTVDDYLTFARMLLRQGDGLLTPRSVELMTTNRLTAAQLETAGMLLAPRGWGYGMAVDARGRYGWEGGSGTTWTTDPATGRIAIGMTQTSEFLFGGALVEFTALALS